MSESARNRSGLSATLRVLFKGREEGYALPAVLFLVTILFLLATSAITLLSFSRRQAISQIVSIKASYAAESGMSIVLANIQNQDDLTRALDIQQHTYRFPDRSSAVVRAIPWGGFLFLSSSGSSAQDTSTQNALVADSPGELFNNALVFANPKHQLVFAGESAVRGNIVVGERGTTTGGLKGRQRPTNVPVEGRIVRSGIALHNPTSELLARTLFNATTSEPLTLTKSELTLDDLGRATHVSIRNDVSISGSLARVDHPLYISVLGSATIESRTEARGLVMVKAQGEITIRAGAHLSGVIITSDKSIEIEGKGHIAGQFIAPSILVKDNAHLDYPSWLSSENVGASARGFELHEGSTLEGFVSIGQSGPESLGKFHIHSGAVIVGAVYSLGGLTFDGNVVGSVITSDFYFYEAPTRYHGWLRAGEIDRTQLPRGFLLPIGDQSRFKLRILEWL